MSSKVFLILGLGVTVFLGACNLGKVQNETGQLIEDGQKSISNVVEEIEEVKKTVETTTKKVEETVQDIENAANKLKEAKQAVGEITK